MEPPLPVDQAEKRDHSTQPWTCLVRSSAEAAEIDHGNLVAIDKGLYCDSRFGHNVRAVGDLFRSLAWAYLIAALAYWPQSSAVQLCGIPSA